MALNNSQYDAIMREYDQMQSQHQYELSKRRDEIFEKIPEYEALTYSTPSFAMSCTLKAIAGDSSAVATAKEELQRIKARKQELLLQNGYPADYLEIQYNCSACQDTGYINGEKCACLKKRILSITYAQSNLSELLKKNNFDTISEQYYTGDDLLRFREAVSICHNMVDNFENEKESILFHGNVGVGKSFLSCCVAKELLDRGYSVLYFSSSNLFDTLANSTFGKDSKENLYTSKEDIYNCDLVVIDDLGTELTNSLVFTELFSLITERILRNKSTIISTNLNLADLSNLYSERIISRIIANYKLFKLSGPDIRIYKIQHQ